MTAAMLPSTHTVTDKLRQTYNGVLLQISFNLSKKHQRKLRQYCNGLVSTNVTDTVDIFHTLEHERKISWEDVNFVKEAMHEIRRFDIVKELTEYEIKRDLTLLLDFHARKILQSELQCCSVAVKRVAGYLARLAEVVRDKVDITEISFTVESSKDMRKVLVDFEEEIDCRELTFSWSEFTMLVIIAGEIIAAASMNEERQEPLVELCFTAADELCSRMTELGSWEDFCSQVKERYSLVYHRQDMEPTPGLSLRKQRAEVVKKLTEFFSRIDKSNLNEIT
ncbi:hypothetical protein ACROYT_G002221 [Oculina patagonica]